MLAQEGACTEFPWHSEEEYTYFRHNYNICEFIHAHPSKLEALSIPGMAAMRPSGAPANLPHHLPWSAPLSGVEAIHEIHFFWILWMTLRGPGESAEKLDGGVVQLGRCRGPRRPEDRIPVLTSSAAPAVGLLGTL